MIQDKPELFLENLFIWDSFIKLSTERKLEYGNIPYSKIIWFAERHNIWDIECFEYLIKSLDSVILEDSTNQLKQSKK